MLNEVIKYLAQYQQLSLPGIGSFHIETKPAQLDFINRIVNAKQSVIVFSNNKPSPENSFYSFLADELHTDKDVAVTVFDNYVAQLTDALATQQQVYLQGIGTLTKQHKSIEFLPDTMPVFYPELVAEKIIRKNAAHTVRVGEDERTSEEMHAALHERTKAKTERWIIAASILAVIGIAAIVLYYTAFS